MDIRLSSSRIAEYFCPRMGKAHRGSLLSENTPQHSAAPDVDCMTCSPSERWERPNRAHITITDEDTGQRLRVCGGCLAAGIHPDLVISAAPTEVAPELGDPLPAPARA